MESESEKPLLSEKQRFVLAGILMLGAAAVMRFYGGTPENPDVLPLLVSVHLFCFGAAVLA